MKIHANRGETWSSRLLGRRGQRPRRSLGIGDRLDWILEERQLLSTGGPIPFPIAKAGSLAEVMYDGVTGDFVKTITINNNSPTQTIFAFLEGENTRQAISPYEGTAAFDPFDSSNHEYRGYVGYSDGMNQYAGIPPLSAITITVPLVFWDSGRIIFSTDGSDQFSTFGGDDSGSPPGAPFYYQDVNTQALYFGSIDPNDPTRLNFTAEYDNFGTQAPFAPTTSEWKSPVAKGIFQQGRQLLVTGPGLPAAGALVTVDASNPGYVVLPKAADSKTPPVQQYIFSSLPGQSISPTDRYIQGGFTLTKQGGPSSTNGVVMWYHALKALSPNNDAPFQLAEFTFRGRFYDPNLNPGTGFEYLIGTLDGIDADSADYDISFVDTINLPVAMAASNVAIPNTNETAPFGWVGSSQTLEDFQQALADFTSSNPNRGTNANFLGSYFGGQGYPSYLKVDPGNIKLPAGQNLFLASPVIGGAADIKYFKKFSDGSVIDQPLHALTSGGDGPTTLLIGGDPTHPSQGVMLGLNTTSMANSFALENLIAPNLARGFEYTVSYSGKFAGNAVGLYRDANQNIIGVRLDRPVPPNAASQVYGFQLPQKDYAAGGIAGLWYSWADYYADRVNSTARSNLPGTMKDNILTLANATPGLVPGMAVTSLGLPDGCVVLSVAPDQKTLQLSEVATGNPTSFDFARPSLAALVGADPKGNTPLVDLTFPATQQAQALAFARTVYIVMSAWGVSVPAGTQNGWVTLLTNIIGGNLGPNYLPHANTDVVVALTNMSKSALRGVPDFTSPLFSNPAQWYPDPALSAGGLSYNAFNLNPFVWFIHDKLGSSAYAFALDDDIGNVNAGGADHIDIAIGGLNGLPNKDPYTTTSPWGVVTSLGTSPQSRSNVLGMLTNPKIVYQVAQFDYSNNIPGTLVNGPGVPLGTTVQFTQIPPDLQQARLVLSQSLASNPTAAPYAFFGSLVFRGNVLGKGQPNDTIILDSSDAYDTLLKIGPLQNIQVTGEGIDPSSMITIKQISRNPTTGAITVQLSANLIASQVSQPGGFYAYTFGGAAIGVVRDPSFEWANVQGLIGNFNHGPQLTQNTVDWTFTDSPTHSTWYAGIAFDNASAYTSGNPQAPQGLQVGFVQGDSRVSQRVILGMGTYTLSLSAAQGSINTNPQAVNVLLDGNPIGSIQPSGAAYEQFVIQFNTTAGPHALAFQGTRATADTVLMDGLLVKLVTNSAALARSRTPARVEFLAQPASAAPGAAPTIRVAVYHGGGGLLNGVPVRLTLLRVSLLPRARLTPSRVLQTTTVNGVATFNRLSGVPRGLYVLRAEAGRQQAISRVFAIGP